MNAKEKSDGAVADLELAYDVGHSSLGWAVLRQGDGAPEILGCGVVIFGADDCLASKRRDYRRQRRHARSTRQRIARMEKLLAHLKVLTAEQLKAKHQQAGGHPAPWLLAARILASKGNPKYCVNWSDLWDVLRWYAHNRGYDGNARWSNVSDEILSAAEQEEKKGDTEKEKNAVELMAKYNHKQTMAETVFADLFARFNVADPLSVESLPFLQKRFKANQCAFPRKVVESEVTRILEAHIEKLPQCSKEFIHLLLAKELTEQDRKFLGEIGIGLPKRFQGGLLFGQLIPRFDNRIIGECPISGAKVPNKHCHEFLEFRWAMTLANIRVGFGDETYSDGAKLRSLTAEERRQVDAAVRRLGFLKVEPDKPGKDGLVRRGKNELRDILLKETRCDRHSLDTLLLHPDAKEALKLLPIKGDMSAFRMAWGSFADPDYDENGRYRDDALRHRFTTQLLRGKKLAIQRIIKDLERLGEQDLATRIREAAENEARRKKSKPDPDKLAQLLNAEFYCEKLKGRARFSRAKLAEAVQQVFHKSKPIHPLEKGGCLEQTEEVKRAALEKPLDNQTNNHLVRHRLLILRRLQDHILTEFASANKKRVARITVEVARDLQTMSGMTNKEKAKELTGKLAHHHKVAEELAANLRDANGNPLKDSRGGPIRVTANLIRKARIRDDLENKCVYTGQDIELVHLVSGDPRDVNSKFADKDHIIPRSQRLSDALEAQVVTFSAINRMKGKRTALQFIKDFGGKPVEGMPNLYIRTEAQFRAFVDLLWPKTDPFKRARAGGKRVSDDEARCWRRKQLLLVERFEEKEFTPADLTKTRHITKLAAQQLEGAFWDFSPEQRPPVISITGAVTQAFRDRTWKLLPLLGAANAEVLKLVEKEKAAKERGESFNFKKEVRDVTHLHHALDAVSLGLITSLLVPSGSAGRAGLNGELARLIHKGRLSDDERRQFEGLVRELRLPRFYISGPDNRLDIQELDQGILEQIRQCLREKRVVQHIPSDMSGLKVEENTRGIEKIENGRVYLHQRKRDDKTGKLTVSPTDEAVGKALGLRPPHGESKLKQASGVRVILDNFGVAILDHALVGEERFAIVPHHKVWHRIQELKPRNGGKSPRILRIGTLIRVPRKAGRSDYRGIWMVRGAQINQKAGYLVDISAPDVIEYRVPGRDDCAQNIRLQSLFDGGLEILKAPLTGLAACPTTSSA